MRDASAKYLGKTFVSKNGEKVTVIDYNNATKITVRYENGFIQILQGANLIRGNFKSPYLISHCGYGYIGEGKYKPTVKGVKTEYYKAWCSMLERCYGNSSTFIVRGYGSECCEEWHNFQNFAEWYENNYYIVGEEKMCLDKDILIKGNTIYSPTTCCIVPNSINCLIVGSDSIRGEYPIGVSYKHGEGYYARCNDGNNKTVYLGTYKTPEEAFAVYKNYKEKVIKLRAKELSGVMPHNVVQALYNYEIGIDD